MDGGSAIYDYVDTDIIIWNTELCYIVNNEFDLSLTPGIKEKIDKELSIEIWHYLSNRGSELHITGTYGDHYLNDWF